MPYSAWYQCIAGCPGRHRLEEVVYRCPRCAELLEVAHDLEALRKRSPEAWKGLFDQRAGRGAFPCGSGVWAKKEWVYPTLDDASVVSLGEGLSSLLRVEGLGKELGAADLWVKQCGTSHTGSFKDLGMTVLVSAVRQMRAQGKKIRAVVCASTGDTSAALAAYCAAAGIPSIVLLPRAKVSTAQLVQPLASGSLVLSLDTDFDGCMKVVQAIAEDPTLYLANSMNSLRIEGQKTVAIEICQQLGWEPPDWVVIPGGNLGNVSALGKGFLLLRDLGLIQRLPRVAVAQAANANPLYRAFRGGFASYQPVQAQKTLASAIQIGDPVSVKKAIRVLEQLAGVVGQAGEEALAEACARADRHGLFTCPQTGVALAVARQLVEEGTIDPKARVVVISTAHGLKFTDFKVGYHEGRFAGVSASSRNRPIELPAAVEQVRSAIDRFAPTVS